MLANDVTAERALVPGGERGETAPGRHSHQATRTLAVLDVEGDHKQEIAPCWVGGSGQRPLVVRRGTDGSVLRSVTLDGKNSEECPLRTSRSSTTADASFRRRLLDAGPGLRADGQGRIATHLTRVSTPAGEAQPAAHPGGGAAAPDRQGGGRAADAGGSRPRGTAAHRRAAGLASGRLSWARLKARGGDTEAVDFWAQRRPTPGGDEPAS
jgi:hypothetical protein